MFAGAYKFTGDVEDLKAAHAKMLEIIGSDGLSLHVAIVGDDSLTVIDACPSREVFEQFSQGDFLRSVLDKAGLPEPTIEPLGDVHAAFLNS